MAAEMGIVEELVGQNCTENWNVYARGFRTRIGDPLQYMFPVVMLQIIAVSILSRAIHFLLRPLKQPKFVCQVLAGVILGPSVLGRFDSYAEKMIEPRESTLLYLMSNITTYYQLFLLCVKMDITVILKTSGKRVWSIGIISLFLPLFTALSLVLLNARYDLINDERNGKKTSLQAFLLMAASAFPQIALSLDELNLLTSELGNLAMSCAVVNDFFRISLILLVSVSFKIKEPGYIYYIPAFMLFLYGLRVVPLWINKNTTEGKPVQEKYIVGILLGVLCIGYMSLKILGSPATGLLILGLIIPDGPALGATLVKKTELILSEFLLPLFYVEVGLNFVLSRESLAKNWKVFATYQLFIGVIFMAKLLGCFLPAAFIHKMSYRNSFLLGIVMNFKGFIEGSGFTFWRYGSKSRLQIDDKSYVALMFSITVISALTTPIVGLLYKPEKRLAKSTKHSLHNSIQSSPIDKELRMLVCVHEEESVGSIITLLESSNATSTAPINSHVIHLIELVGRAAPLLLKYNKKGSMRKSSKTARIMNAFENYSSFAHGRVVIKPFTLVAPFNGMHEVVCRLAEDKEIPFIIFPINHYGINTGEDENAAKIRNICSNLQNTSTCTVGVLINRGMNDILRYENFSYQVAVIFLGGLDDREALAYGIRMSGHPSVSITLLRIHVTKEKGGNNYSPEMKVERQFDDKLVEEFKRKNANNACALYRGEVVDDIVSALNMIKSLGNKYDLVMVGRRRSASLGLDTEMEDWNENPELGFIGDMVASPEEFGGMVSVLAVQHFGEVDGWWRRQH